jgi:succinyl-diaminopimelate desuccinylase
MDALKLLRELVEIDTAINPAEGKYPDAAALSIVREEAESLGFTCELIRDGGLNHMLAHRGEGEPRLLLMAHLDTVPFNRDEWSHDPLKLTVEGEKAYGRGALDDKGNVAAILSALGEAGDEEGTIMLAITMDEEAGGRGAKLIRDRLAEESRMPAMVVNADGNGMVIINRRRGVFEAYISVPSAASMIRGVTRRVEFRLDYKVRPPHHAAYFLPGVDSHPLIALSQFVRVNDAHVSELGGSWLKTNVIPSIVWGNVVIEDPTGDFVPVDEGLTSLIKAVVPLTRPVIRGKAPSEYGINATPNYYRRRGESHELVLDIRAMTDDEAEVRRAIEEQLGDLEAEVQLHGGGGYLFTSQSSNLVKAAMDTLRKIGVAPQVVEMNGASDSRYFSPLGIDAIDFGPRGGNIHGPDEYVDIKSLELTIKFYARLVEAVMTPKAHR